MHDDKGRPKWTRQQMYFFLMNAGKTFQRAMDITFVGEKDKFIVIYLDDIIVFFELDE